MTKYKDADELLKRLNTCKYSVKKLTKRQVTYNYAISQACRIVDIPRWIPVTERLPEEGSYLCTENHLGTIFVDVSCFDGKQWCLPNGNPHFVTEVIAWMPLPEPYKGGEEE